MSGPESPAADRAAPSDRRETLAALQPIAASERAFGWKNHASLWFVLGVGLLVLQAGTYLAPMVGLRQGLVAVVLGSVIGSGILAWVARIACATGLSSAGLMYRVFGRGFGRVPIVLNVLQLVGWTTFELVILRGAIRTIGQHLGAADWGAPLPGILITLACGGALILLLLVAPMVKLVQRVVTRYDLPLALLALAWLSWQFGRYWVSRGGLPLRAPTGGGSLFAAMDLVIAMPVSWLPVVADYARHGRLERGGPGKALSGTWLGYAIANIWCYALGVLVAAAAPGEHNLAVAVAVVQGGLAALGAMLIHEFSNTYGSAYSASVSAGSVWARIGPRGWLVVIAIACTLGAMVLPMHSMQPFLLDLSSVFVPLFGLILGRLGWARSARIDVAPAHIDWSTTAAWLAGIALYQGLTRFAPAVGSTLPTLALTFLWGWLAVPHAQAAALRPMRR